MMIVFTIPPANPATIPSAPPISSAMATGTTPAISDSRPP